MSFLLETNRKLSEELAALKTELQKEKLAHSDHLHSLEREKTELREGWEQDKTRVEKEKQKLEREKRKLDKALATSSDELVAMRTYVSYSL